MRSKRCRERKETTDCGCCTGERGLEAVGWWDRTLPSRIRSGTLGDLSPMWMSGIVVPDVGPLCKVVAESPQSSVQGTGAQILSNMAWEVEGEKSMRALGNLGTQSIFGIA